MPPTVKAVAADTHTVATEFWTCPYAIDGKQVRITTSFLLDSLNEINSAKGTARLKYMMMMQWSDPRFKGWPATRALPADVWCPHPRLLQATGDSNLNYGPIEIHDREKGILKTSMFFDGAVLNPMDVHDFPFDADTLLLKYVCSEFYPATNKSRNDALMTKVPASQVTFCPPEKVEKLFQIFMPEDQLLCGYKVVGFSFGTSIAHVDGKSWRYMDVGIRLVRQPQYYLWKALAPIHFLFLVSLTVFFFEPYDISGRMSFIITSFLAVFAHWHMVTAVLPETSNLTAFDKNFILFVLFMAFFAVESVIAKRTADSQGSDGAITFVDMPCLWLFSIGWCVGSAYIFFKPWHNRFSNPHALHGQYPPGTSYVNLTARNEQNSREKTASTPVDSQQRVKALDKPSRAGRDLNSGVLVR